MLRVGWPRAREFLGTSLRGRMSLNLIYNYFLRIEHTIILTEPRLVHNAPWKIFTILVKLTSTLTIGFTVGGANLSILISKVTEPLRDVGCPLFVAQTSHCQISDVSQNRINKNQEMVNG